MSETQRTPRDWTPQLACTDAGWSLRCRPLLVFLATPRTWSELTAWASERTISGCELRNMLAWLEGERIAGTFIDRRRLAAGEHSPMWRGYEARPRS